MKATMATWRCLIIMENVIPLDHVDDLPVELSRINPDVVPVFILSTNQPDVVPVIPEHVLVDEDEDPEEEEFEEEEEHQEEKDMDVDDEEDGNEPKLTFPYEEADPLNPPPPTSDLEPEDVIKVEDTVEYEDETIPASVYEVVESSTASFYKEDSDDDACIGRKEGKGKDEYYVKLILDLGNEVRSSVEEGTAAMENLFRKLGNAKERAECKKLKKELEDARSSNTLLCIQNEQVKRDLYWNRVSAYEFYQEMIHRGVMFEERPNEAIDVPVEDEESPSSELRGSLRDS
ncbi:hypothetical protein Tco_0590580 [Tanacetum coccineum]